MAKLFDRDKSVISRHIKNALEEEADNSTVAKFDTLSIFIASSEAGNYGS